MKARYYVELVILAAIWGASFMFTRIAVPEFGPIPLTAFRAGISALTLFPLLILHGHWPTLKQHWGHILVVGLISTAIPFCLISVTTQYTSAGFTSILNSLTPIFSAIVASLWLKEYLNMPAVLGILLSFVGVMVMVMDKDSISGHFVLLPTITAVLATFLYGLTGNYSRKFLENVAALPIAGGCHLFAALFLLPLAVWQWPQGSISLLSWTSAIVLGVLCTGIAFIMFFRLLNSAGVTKTVIVTYLVPVFAMIWGKLFLGEIITAKMLMGAFFILTGIALTTGLLRRWPEIFKQR